MYIKNQLKKVEAHYKALKEFYDEIKKLDFDFTVDSYENCKPCKKLY